MINKVDLKINCAECGQYIIVRKDNRQWDWKPIRQFVENNQLFLESEYFTKVECPACGKQIQIKHIYIDALNKFHDRFEIFGAEINSRTFNPTDITDPESDYYKHMKTCQPTGEESVFKIQEARKEEYKDMYKPKQEQEIPYEPRS